MWLCIFKAMILESAATQDNNKLIRPKHGVELNINSQNIYLFAPREKGHFDTQQQKHPGVLWNQKEKCFPRLASLLVYICLSGKWTPSFHKQEQFRCPAFEHSEPFPLTILMSVEGCVLHTNTHRKPGKKVVVPAQTICGVS